MLRWQIFIRHRSHELERQTKYKMAVCSRPLVAAERDWILMHLWLCGEDLRLGASSARVEVERECTPAPKKFIEHQSDIEVHTTCAGSSDQ